MPFAKLPETAASSTVLPLMLAGKAVGESARNTMVIEANESAETASKYHQSKTVELIGWTLGPSRP